MSDMPVQFELMIESGKNVYHVDKDIHFIKFLEKRLTLSSEVKRWGVGVKFLQISGKLDPCQGAILLPNLIGKSQVVDLFTVSSKSNNTHSPQWIKFYPILQRELSKIEIQLVNFQTGANLKRADQSPQSPLSTVVTLNFKEMRNMEFVYHFASNNYPSYPGNNGSHFYVDLPAPLHLDERHRWKMCLIQIRWPSTPQTSIQDLKHAYVLEVYDLEPKEDEVRLDRMFEANEEEERNGVDEENVPIKVYRFRLGYVGTESAIAEGLNKLLQKMNTQNKVVHFATDDDGHLTCHLRYLALRFNKPLAQVLGLGHEETLLTENLTTFRETMDLKRFLPTCLLLKCDVVRDVENGDKLCLFPVTSNSHHYECSHPNYVDIDVNRLSRIEFTLCRPGGEPILFTNDKPTLISVQIKRAF